MLSFGSTPPCCSSPCRPLPWCFYSGTLADSHLTPSRHTSTVLPSSLASSLSYSFACLLLPTKASLQVYILYLVISTITCFILDSFNTLCEIFKEEILGKPKESAKILIPALLYTIQNNLLFLALTNLDAATYQVRFCRI